jgi:HAD superfamily phosphoserine phosphatase-like hydrolase
VTGTMLEMVSFDVDGTILRGRILNYLRVPMEYRVQIEALHESHHKGRLGYEETLRAQFSLLAGMKASEIMPRLADLPLVDDLRVTLERFSVKGVKAVILTDNPSFAVDPMRSCGFKDVIASEIETQGGLLTDRIRLLTNKLHALRKYCVDDGIDITHVAHVGDGFNDVVAFRGLCLSIAFNSREDEASRAATYRVNSDSMFDVYRVLEMNLGKQPDNSDSE